MAIDAGTSAVMGTHALGELDVHRITEVGQVAVVPRAHRLARKRRVSLAELEGERLVMPPPGRPQRIALDAALSARGVRVRAGALATGWDLTVRLVELGAGLAIVNGSVHIPRGLVARPIAELPRLRYVAFTRRRPREDATSLVRALVAHGDAWKKRSAGADRA